MALVIQQLVNRLKDKASGSFTATIAQNHLQLVQSQMEAHFRSRQEADKIAVIRLNGALMANHTAMHRNCPKTMFTRVHAHS